MYNPYGNAEGYNVPPQFQGQQHLQHPQPTHPMYQQGQYSGPSQGQPEGAGQPQFSNFLHDPASMLASQFAKNGFDNSNQYIQQNFGQFINGTGNDLKYYFKVSNRYVLNKIAIILFPYYNKNWGRQTSRDMGVDVTAATPSVQFAPPVYDVNAPDLYIPSMAFITYILSWASFQGIKGEFHPQLFGYLASQTLACSILDVFLFKIGLYLLNCSTQSSLWDLVSFSGYKYVSVIVLLFYKNLVGDGWFVYYPVVFILITNLSVFLMRSLKFLVLPNNIGSATNSISINQRRIRIQFLFLYSVVLQGLLILFMSK